MKCRCNDGDTHYKIYTWAGLESMWTDRGSVQTCETTRVKKFKKHPISFEMPRRRVSRREKSPKLWQIRVEVGCCWEESGRQAGRARGRVKAAQSRRVAVQSWALQATDGLPALPTKASTDWHMIWRKSLCCTDRDLPEWFFLIHLFVFCKPNNL